MSESDEDAKEQGERKSHDEETGHYVRNIDERTDEFRIVAGRGRWMAQDAQGGEPGRAQRTEDQHRVGRTDPRRSTEPAPGRGHEDRKKDDGDRDRHRDQAG